VPFTLANGIETYYETQGEGPPLLLIAGNGMDHTAFVSQVPQFKAHFQCITYDMRGIGRSSSATPGYTVTDMAEDALALLTSLGHDSAHVAGYSLGGAIAQEMVLRAPGRVRSLSLYSTYDRPEPYLELRYDLLLKILRETTPEIWAMFTAFSAFGQDYVNGHKEEVRTEIKRRVARWSERNAPTREGLEGHYRAILSHNTRDRLGVISCPTFIAVGSDDPVTPVYYAKRLHEAIRGSEIVIFAGKPHRLLTFDAEHFTERALDFLLRNRQVQL
jgi:3-oxoadipate enol-lactonase